MSEIHNRSLSVEQKKKSKITNDLLYVKSQNW